MLVVDSMKRSIQKVTWPSEVFRVPAVGHIHDITVKRSKLLTDALNVNTTLST